MKLSQVSFISLLLILTFVVGACAGPLGPPVPVAVPTIGATPPASVEREPSIGEVTAHSGPVTGYVSLVDALRAAGATLKPTGTVEQPFFPVPGQVIQVDGEDVQVFEFEDSAMAQAQAEQLPKDGSSFPTLMITWVAPPHFFQAGEVIVLYLGDNAELLDLLQSVLGPQVAGR